MLFWIAIALLTFAVAAVFLLPLMRGMARGERLARDGAMAVYRDQLQELERDRGQGLVSGAQADYARAEIARRLLAEEEGASTGGAAPDVPAKGMADAGLRRHRIAQALVIIAVPGIGLGTYLSLGSPGLPDQPLAVRLANPGNDMPLLVAAAERQLMRNPDDLQGWTTLAPIYLRQGRLAEAETAMRNILRLDTRSPDRQTSERLSALGEVVMAQANGVVTEAARQLFQSAIARQADNPQAAYYLALGLEQAGRRAEALAAFSALAKASPADAPWQPIVAQHIARNGAVASPDGSPATGPATAGPDLNAAPGNPSAADVAAAETMAAGDRQQMIRGMVESLDARLKANPDNFEGWMRLVRSYSMLQEEDRAMEALRSGLKRFPAEGSQGQQLIAMARQLGLPVEEALK